MSFRDEFKDQGYSKEEEYFHRKDRELLEKLREKAAAQREQLETENKKKEYWMRCPKCGSELKEEQYGAVMVDRCGGTKCGGIFFDGGELEMLMQAKPSLFKRILGG